MQVIDPREEAKKIHVPTYDEILEKIKSRYPKGRGLKPIDRELTRLQTIRNILIDRTSFIRSLVRLLDNLHPFYWRLIEIEFDRREIHRAISCVSRSRKLVSEFWEKYRFHILAAETPRELRRVSSEARGRMMSSVKRCSKGLQLLRSLVVFLQHLPSINPSLPTIIVAGPPSSGKSTLINTVSTASPEVAPYPFTTKKIHIGHYEVDSSRIQLIDTPGILDRSPEEMNQVERRAVAALREIPGAILYLVDPTPSSYLPLEKQFKLFIKIHRFTGSKPHYIGINKVDEAPKEAVEQASRLSEDMIEKGLARRYYTMAAKDPVSAAMVVTDIIMDIGSRPPAARP